jgi:hypothetical protein
VRFIDAAASERRAGRGSRPTAFITQPEIAAPLELRPPFALGTPDLVDRIVDERRQKNRPR